MLFTGCASPYIKKGEEALKQNNCKGAYDNFKKAPGTLDRGSKIADSLAKTTECMADQEIKQANELQSRAQKLSMPGAEQYYQDALAAIDRARRWYQEALQYAETFSRGSGSALNNRLQWIHTTVAQ